MSIDISEIDVTQTVSGGLINTYHDGVTRWQVGLVLAHKTSQVNLIQSHLVLKSVYLTHELFSDFGINRHFRVIGACSIERQERLKKITLQNLKHPMVKQFSTVAKWVVVKSKNMRFLFCMVSPDHIVADHGEKIRQELEAKRCFFSAIASVKQIGMIDLPHFKKLHGFDYAPVSLLTPMEKPKRCGGNSSSMYREKIAS